jgi:hypothetical protein
VKSVKPGRGESGMAAVGSVIAILFGIVWMIFASSITNSAREFSSFGIMAGPADIASVVFPLFGLLFIGAGVASAIYHYRNYKGKERYSIVDIVDSKEEGDPAAPHITQDAGTIKSHNPGSNYCTECGRRLDGDFKFCPGCGKDLSENK